MIRPKMNLSVPTISMIYKKQMTDDMIRNLRNDLCEFGMTVLCRMSIFLREFSYFMN